MGKINNKITNPNFVCTQYGSKDAKSGLPSCENANEKSGAGKKKRFFGLYIITSNHQRVQQVLMVSIIYIYIYTTILLFESC